MTSLRDLISQRASELAWHGKAACRDNFDAHGQVINPEWWFPSSGNSHAFTLQAKAICNRCPVRDICLETGWEEQGTWGAMSREERVAAQELGYNARDVLSIRNAKEEHDADEA